MRIEALEAIIFDFDGVLTTNRVYVSQDGSETVCCHRGDGLGFDFLRTTSLKLFILSTETNPVVTQRAKKLNVPVRQGVANKRAVLKKLCLEEGMAMSRVLFVGNDLNDYSAMALAGYSACPSDSHPSIRKMASFVLKTAGGQGIVRELVEDLFEIDLLSYVRTLENEESERE